MKMYKAIPKRTRNREDQTTDKTKIYSEILNMGG
jgi:hypothetical protein